MAIRLPLEPLAPTSAPQVVDRETWQRACDELLVREKALTRESDTLAAARRRLPMTAVPADATVGGPDGPVPFRDVFEGRSQLITYFHMWHDGHPPEGQCEGCTFFTAGVQQPEYLHSRDVTLAIMYQGSYPDVADYAAFVGNRLPFYSAGGADAVLAGRGFGFFASFLRQGDDVFETWWATGRGTEAMSPSYQLLDRTVYGRQETWEDSPAGWPQLFDASAGAQFRAAGRPTVQWAVTDVPVAVH
jgi:predicted dithiol-disulfide oxidoreductase (DUF899 family)